MRTIRLLLLASLLGGCLVRTTPVYRERERGCPGGFHPDDGHCVKNHDRDDDDHRRGDGDHDGDHRDRDHHDGDHHDHD